MEAVKAIHAAMFSRGSQEFVARVFEWTVEAFEGRYRDYQAVDARYHDLEHTPPGNPSYASILQDASEQARRPSSHNGCSNSA